MKPCSQIYLFLEEIIFETLYFIQYRCSYASTYFYREANTFIFLLVLFSSLFFSLVGRLCLCALFNRVALNFNKHIHVMCMRTFQNSGIFTEHALREISTCDSRRHMSRIQKMQERKYLGQRSKNISNKKIIIQPNQQRKYLKVQQASQSMIFTIFKDNLIPLFSLKVRMLISSQILLGLSLQSNI